jgi:Zn-dependent metalloprotease
MRRSVALVSAVVGVSAAAAGGLSHAQAADQASSSRAAKGARTATLNAAKDLYGASSAQYNTVAAAWSAVAVS